MPASSLLALIDDIASLLDDVAVLSKVAAKKTAGVLGDDLALNAQQVAGVTADRELPVVWAVARGSLVNKAILVPAALALSALLPVAVLPLLMLGGAYLCLEGVEKIAHTLAARRGEARPSAPRLAPHGAGDAAALERLRIRGAIRTDFVLSAEIVVIVLNTVADRTFVTRASVLAVVAVLMTVGVYGLVAGIVKLDDVGLWLVRRAGRAPRAVGTLLLGAAPWVMRSLSVLGTAAMFLVGGGILRHGIPGLGHLAGTTNALAGAALDGTVGLLAGVVVFAMVSLARRVF